MPLHYFCCAQRFAVTKCLLPACCWSAAVHVHCLCCCCCCCCCCAHMTAPRFATFFLKRSTPRKETNCKAASTPKMMTGCRQNERQVLLLCCTLRQCSTVACVSQSHLPLNASIGFLLPLLLSAPSTENTLKPKCLSVLQRPPPCTSMLLMLLYCPAGMQYDETVYSLYHSYHSVCCCLPLDSYRISK
jgi:hypothetical protein